MHTLTLIPAKGPILYLELLLRTVFALPNASSRGLDCKERASWQITHIRMASGYYTPCFTTLAAAASKATVNKGLPDPSKRNAASLMMRLPRRLSSHNSTQQPEPQRTATDAPPASMPQFASPIACPRPPPSRFPHHPQQPRLLLTSSTCDSMVRPSEDALPPM